MADIAKMIEERIWPTTDSPKSNTRMVIIINNIDKTDSNTILVLIIFMLFNFFFLAVIPNIT